MGAPSVGSAAAESSQGGKVLQEPSWKSLSLRMRWDVPGKMEWDVMGGVGWEVKGWKITSSVNLQPLSYLYRVKLAPIEQT